MYLAEIFAENFRIFGSGDKALCLRLQKGLNALVGENDGGKSAVVDAIRYCLWTTSLEYHRFTLDDFHCDAISRAADLRIRCKFEELSTDDQAWFLEWLTPNEDGQADLFVHLRAKRLEGSNRVAVDVHSGPEGDGPPFEGAVRELLRTTYLRPLRDAEAELSPGRNSRLSQILASDPDIRNQEQDDFDPVNTDSGKTLVGIVKRAEHEIARNEAVVGANERITKEYLSQFQIGPHPLRSEVSVAGDTTLNKILEKLELGLAKHMSCAEKTKRGLGYNNALFMAAELLLLGANETYPTLLIEEPEAHLHPQLQASVIALLREKALVPDLAQHVQVVMTTHSPNLAATLPLGCLTLIHAGTTYSLAKSETCLDEADYAFLERFLDVTKANLFFARGVVIVEGDAENILLPALAEKVGHSFQRSGVSVVNVGHVGLFRYSRIFKRNDGSTLPIRVACIRDRDVLPDEAPDEWKGKSRKKESELKGEEIDSIVSGHRKDDGGAVRTFVSDRWTFEFDLAAASWKMAEIMRAAVETARLAANSWPTEEDASSVRSSAKEFIEQAQADGKTHEAVAVEIFRPLHEKAATKTVTAQFAALFVAESNDLAADDLPEYLRQAFQYVTV